MIRDVGSSNGTFINGVRLSEEGAISPYLAMDLAEFLKATIQLGCVSPSSKEEEASSDCNPVLIKVVSCARSDELHMYKQVKVHNATLVLINRLLDEIIGIIK